MGLPRRHPRRPRGRGVPRLRGARAGTSCRTTWLRDGPHGPGMVQAWQEPDPEQEAVDAGAGGAGARRLAARLRRRRRPRPRRLAGPRGHRRRCAGWRSSTWWSTTPTARAATCWRWPTGTGTASTTGSRFHAEPKLRTVLWGWAGEPLDRRGASPASSGCSTALARRPRATQLGRAPHRPRDRARSARRCRAAARPRARCPAPRGTGPRSRGRRSEARAPALGFAACARGPLRRSPSLPVAGPAGARSTTPRPAAWSTTAPEGPARLYVCGITPYDATHLGHAATYVAFDLLNRAWRNAGHEVRLRPERHRRRRPAARAGRRKVRRRLGRARRARDRAVPPGHGGAAGAPARRTTSARSSRSRWWSTLIERLAGGRRGLPGRGRPLLLGDRRPGVRRGVRLRPRARCSRSSPSAAATPTAPGKKDPLDCVVWRGRARGRAGLGQPVRPRPARAGTSSAPRSRWTTSARAFDVQGGGSDLVFPHHEMCAGHAQVADPGTPFAQAYAHAGMVGYDGEKMSKSRGNLVFVSALRNSDVDPMAIRLALLRHHYRADWEWTDAELWDAVDTLADWRTRARPRRRRARRAGRRPRCSPRWPTTSTRPRALAAVDAWVAATLGTDGLGRHHRPDAADAARPRSTPPSAGARRLPAARVTRDRSRPRAGRGSSLDRQRSAVDRACSSVGRRPSRRLR